MQASVLILCRCLISGLSSGLSSRLLAMFFLAGLTTSLLVVQSTQVRAQSVNDFTVEVRVADQGRSERNSAYLLAFDRVLRRQVETRVRVEPAQREELMQDPSLYVQRFRYRSVVPGQDDIRLATRSVRNGTAPAAVIAVTFPTDLAAIIQQQLIPVAEEPLAPVIAPVIALVAVEQQGNQFIIGGDRGRRFQQRATELAAANNLQLQFPEITPEDLTLISASDIFNADAERINAFIARYAGNELLTGAIYRLSPTTWQSDWSFTGLANTGQEISTAESPLQEQQTRTFSLTTMTLDEALVAAMTQIGPGNGYLSGDTSVDSFERAGVVIRVENIRSLTDYDNVLAQLRQLDTEVMTESLEFNSIVFRASEQAAQRVRNSLSASNSFQPINDDQVGQGLSFRYLAR